jgi:NADH-quinone oxidoreductase subunit H
MGFALFFLAEYSNIILMSLLAAVLFLGGWHGIFDLSFSFQPYWVQWILINIVPSIWFSLKILLFMFFFVIIRGALPRYRYDQLMRLGWKIFLPITLAFLVMVSSSSIFFLYF